MRKTKANAAQARRTNVTAATLPSFVARGIAAQDAVDAEIAKADRARKMEALGFRKTTRRPK